MQYVNDDMDDVFKKAGEDYPLHTGMPDWDKVAHALNEQKLQQPGSQSNGKKYLWLLLLPITFICNRYINTGSNFIGNEPDAVEKSTEQKALKSKVSKEPEIANGKNKTPDLVSKIISPADKILGTTNDAIVRNNFFEKPLKSVAKGKHKQWIETKNQRNADLYRDEQAYENNDAVYIQKEESLYTAAKNNITEKAKLLLLNADKSLNTLQATDPLAAVSSTLATDATLHPKVDASVISKSTLHYKKGFYAGVTGSADITSVRLQKPSGLGWHYGLLAGYQFAKRWSVEAGLFTNRKYYYTKGKYFDTAHLYLPPNTDVSEVSGACVMLEIPLAIKYNLSVGGKSAWFVTTGISSYIMKEEEYAYTYHYRSSGNYSVHNKTYRNASTNLLSVLQLSGGYSRQLGRSAALRLEPYLKLPLTGLGYGKLHFSSAGINVGIIKKF